MKEGKKIKEEREEWPGRKEEKDGNEGRKEKKQKAQQK